MARALSLPRILSPDWGTPRRNRRATDRPRRRCPGSRTTLGGSAPGRRGFLARSSDLLRCLLADANLFHREHGATEPGHGASPKWTIYVCRVAIVHLEAYFRERRPVR